MTAPHSPANDRICPSLESPRGAYVATVKDNIRLCTDHFRLVLMMKRFPASTPGQFVQLDCRDPQMPAELEAHDAGPRVMEWPIGRAGEAGAGRPVPVDPDFTAPLAYLRRPFSIADQRTWPDGYTELDIIHRVVGKGTLLLKQLQPGQRVSLLGPLGVGFTGVPGTEAGGEGGGVACLVAGGVGIPPMFYLAKQLEMYGYKSAVAFIGAQRHDLLPVTFSSDGLQASEEGDPVMNVEEFKEWGYPTVISTDDGSMGMKGYVTQALRRFLDERQVQFGKLTSTVVYCCGPTPMMKATAKVAAEFGVPCQVSLEQPMACGMGTCQSCIIKHRPHDAPAGTAWKYKLTCTEGPVFEARDILW